MNRAVKPLGWSLVALAGALGVLMACAPVAEPVVNADAPLGGFVYDDGLNNIQTICHNGRLLYVFNGYQSVALAVIPDAPECVL